jgi:hypothetical protein
MSGGGGMSGGGVGFDDSSTLTTILGGETRLGPGQPLRCHEPPCAVSSDEHGGTSPAAGVLASNLVDAEPTRERKALGTAVLEPQLEASDVTADASEEESLALRSVVQRLGSSSTVARLVVVDVDASSSASIRAQLAGAPFPFSCVRYDVRDPLERSLLRGVRHGRPRSAVHTLPAAHLFLSRAAEALRGAGGSVFLSFGSRRPGAPFPLQRAIGELGFAIRRLVPDFNDYVGAGALGGTSQLYHPVATERRRPLVTCTYDGPIYTASVPS